MKQVAFTKIGMVLLGFALSTMNGNAAPNDARFEKANSEYAAGNFKEAVSDYNTLVQSGEWSANLFYNLGNAYYRTGDYGRAILNYERALRIDRHHPEAQANLRIARDETRGLELTPSLFERYVGAASSEGFIVAAAGLFWLAVLLLVIPRRRSFLMGAIVCFVLSACCVIAIYTLTKGPRGQALAVIVRNNVEARVATADTARSVVALPPGSEVLVIQPRGDWTYAALPNDQRGWIPTEAVEKVQL
jgi:tetratricopeptide (TPR) repeat protein